MKSQILGLLLMTGCGSQEGTIVDAKSEGTTLTMGQSGADWFQAPHRHNIPSKFYPIDLDEVSGFYNAQGGVFVRFDASQLHNGDPVQYSGEVNFSNLWGRLGQPQEGVTQSVEANRLIIESTNDQYSVDGGAGVLVKRTYESRVSDGAYPRDPDWPAERTDWTDTQNVMRIHLEMQDDGNYWPDPDGDYRANPEVLNLDETDAWVAQRIEQKSSADEYPELNVTIDFEYQGLDDWRGAFPMRLMVDSSIKNTGLLGADGTFSFTSNPGQEYEVTLSCDDQGCFADISISTYTGATISDSYGTNGSTITTYQSGYNVMCFDDCVAYEDKEMEVLNFANTATPEQLLPVFPLAGGCDVVETCREAEVLMAARPFESFDDVKSFDGDGTVSTVFFNRLHESLLRARALVDFPFVEAVEAD